MKLFGGLGLWLPLRVALLHALEKKRLHEIRAGSVVFGRQLVNFGDQFVLEAKSCLHLHPSILRRQALSDKNIHRQSCKVNLCLTMFDIGI